jgi:hypothetical protein
MLAAEIFVNLLGAYAAVGLLFAIGFVARGIKRIDPVANGSTIGFRLMVLPGSAALWPLLLRSWIRNKGISHD